MNGGRRIFSTANGGKCTRMEIWAGAFERRGPHQRNGDGLGGHSSLCGLASLREVLLVFIRGDSRDSRVGAGTAAECRGYKAEGLSRRRGDTEGRDLWAGRPRSLRRADFLQLAGEGFEVLAADGDTKQGGELAQIPHPADRFFQALGHSLKAHFQRLDHGLLLGEETSFLDAFFPAFLAAFLS